MDGHNSVFDGMIRNKHRRLLQYVKASSGQFQHAPAIEHMDKKKIKSSEKDIMPRGET